MDRTIGVERFRAASDGVGGTMREITENGKIENPRGYDPGVVENLRQLVRAGGPARRDARRENFYEIEGDEETYYIHVSPVSGNMVLLARWLRQAQDCCLGSGCAVA
jgi:hypothetical protein